MAIGPVLEVKDLARRLSGGRHLRGISFTLMPGDVMGVIGPADSGKSALLSILVGLIPCEPGMVSICGRPPGPGTRELVGYIPPVPGVYEEFTCSEYLNFFCEAFALDLHYRPYQVAEALRLVRMEDHMHTRISDIRSYGLRRRLGVARALVHHPRLVVMDDCLARLDRHETREMVSILTDVRNTGKALVLSSPSLSELSGLCSHLCILVTHRPLACGEIRSLMPQIVNLRMMQVQLLAGTGEALRQLEQYDGVFHLVVSTRTHNLVRFLFNGDDDEFQRLLEFLRDCGVSVVSYAEDHSFLGNVGVP